MNKRNHFLFLCVSHTLLHIYTNIPLALLPILIREYGLSVLFVGIIVSLPRVFSAVFSVPSGLLTDRLDPTKLISFSLFLEVVAALLLLFPSIQAIIVCFSLSALASTFYHPPSLSVAIEILPPEVQSRGLGVHGASGVLGVALGPITLGLVLLRFDWTFVYLVWMVPICAMAILALFLSIGKQPIEKPFQNKIKLTTQLKTIFAITTFLSFFILMVFRSAAAGTISTYLTTYLTESKGLPASLASIIFGLSPLVGLTSAVIGGYLGDKFGLKRSLTVIVSTLTLVLFCLFLSTSITLTVLFYLLYGFFNNMTMPINTSLMAKIAPSKSRGTAFSLQFIPWNITGIVMPIILSVFIDMFEIWVIFPIAILLYLIVLVITQRIRL